MLMFSCPDKQHVFLQRMKKRPTDDTEITNKFAIEPCGAKETMQILNIRRCWALLDVTNFSWVSCHTLCVDNVSQIIDLLLGKITLTISPSICPLREDSKLQTSVTDVSQTMGYVSKCHKNQGTPSEYCL